MSARGAAGGAGRARIGCSGWVYRDWRGRFYPEELPARRWLSHYAGVFDTVEVNSTFYRLASRAGAEEWVRATPPDFLFTVKASRFLTHMKRLADMGQGVERFYERLEPVLAAGRLGPVVWQLPERFRRDDDRLAAALGALPPGRHAFEFRHASWFADEVLALLRAHRVALVIGDHPQRPWQPHALTADWTLVRFHYGRRGRRGNYSRPELEEWARRLADWARRTEVLAYFNNDWEGFAPANATFLRARLRALGVRA